MAQVAGRPTLLVLPVAKAILTPSTDDEENASATVFTLSPAVEAQLLFVSRVIVGAARIVTLKQVEARIFVVVSKTADHILDLPFL